MDHDDLTFDYGFCPRCWWRQPANGPSCDECGCSLVDIDFIVVGGSPDRQRSATDGYILHELLGGTLVAREELPGDVRDELDGGQEALRVTIRHGARWTLLRAGADGLHLYFRKPAPTSAPPEP